jgi:hypothetical protein
MKQIIGKYALYSGIIIAVWLIIFGLGHEFLDGEYGMVYGYTAMLVSFTTIYVAIKAYRDKHNGGFISFGRAFKIGLYITLVTTAVYVGIWLIEYYFIWPDFFDKAAARMTSSMQAKGSSAAEIKAMQDQMAYWKDLCKNPLINGLVTSTEILPIGLLVTTVSGLILRKKTKPQMQA